MPIKKLNKKTKISSHQYEQVCFTSLVFVQKINTMKNVKHKDKHLFLEAAADNTS